MGKYSHLKDKMARFTEEPTYQEKIDKVKKTMLIEAKRRAREQKTQVRTVLAKNWENWDEKKKKLEDELYLAEIYKAAASQLAVTMMEDEELPKFQRPDGVTVSIKDDVYVTVPDRAAYHAWVRDTGQEDLFTVNYQTTSALVKARLLAGEELPPGIGTFFKTTLALYGR